tara:strand:- start:1027 stop:1248 length:222 start_codon:yes stop_codon:yes gene_type:complete
VSLQKALLCDDALMVPLHFQRPQPAKAGFRFDRLHLCPLAPLLNVIRVHGHKFEPQARAKLAAACTNQSFLYL